MATTFTTATTATAAPLSALGTTIKRVLIKIAEGSACARRARYANRLYDLSDAELAKMGIRREGIVQHAFSACFHI